MKLYDKSERCQTMVSPPGMWGASQQHQCEKKAIVVIDEKRYCKIHSPEYVKKMREKQTEKFNKEKKKYMLCYSAPLLLKACKDALDASHNPVVEKILTEAINKVEHS